MELLAGLIRIGDTINSCDVLEIEGVLWLVPEWLEARDEGWRTPARIVLLRPEDVQIPGTHGADLLVLREPPIAALNGLGQSGQIDGWTIQERPEIRLPPQREAH